MNVGPLHITALDSNGVGVSRSHRSSPEPLQDAHLAQHVLEMKYACKREGNELVVARMAPWKVDLLRRMRWLP